MKRTGFNRSTTLQHESCRKFSAAQLIADIYLFLIYTNLSKLFDKMRIGYALALQLGFQKVCSLHFPIGFSAMHYLVRSAMYFQSRASSHAWIR